VTKDFEMRSRQKSTGMAPKGGQTPAPWRLRKSNKTAQARGTVPICSADYADSVQSPRFRSPFLGPVLENRQERGTVPICSADSANLGQSPAVLGQGPKSCVHKVR